MKDWPGNRRGFFKACLSAAGLVISAPQLLASTGGRFKPYRRVRLVTKDGRALRSQDLKARESYIFNYPFVTTPCFLINLGHSASGKNTLDTISGESYEWPGGVGPDQSIVSFAAICAHKLSYPTRTISFIKYQPEKELDNGNGSTKQQVIFCCSENSVYDPARGAQVLGGPAPQPLATIVLEYDKVRDEYYALGTLGPEQYDEFFEKFGFNLELENQVDRIDGEVSDTTIVSHHGEYSRQIKSC